MSCWHSSSRPLFVQQNNSVSLNRDFSLQTQPLPFFKSLQIASGPKMLQCMSAKQSNVYFLLAAVRVKSQLLVLYVFQRIRLLYISLLMHHIPLSHFWLFKDIMYPASQVHIPFRHSEFAIILLSVTWHASPSSEIIFTYVRICFPIFYETPIILQEYTDLIFIIFLKTDTNGDKCYFAILLMRLIKKV